MTDPLANSNTTDPQSAIPTLPEDLSPGAAANDDPIGAETLRRIYRMDNLNRWIWERIDPWIGQRVLEAGCGNGNLTSFMLAREYVCSVDMNRQHLDEMKEKLGSPKNLDTFMCNLEDPKLRDLSEKKIDTVVCLNVLEHVGDHESTLDHFREVLTPGGRLVLLVPAYPALLGTLDHALSHHRRYGREALMTLLRAHGFTPVHHRYVNTFGILGWWLNGKVLKRHLLPSGQLTLYNRLVPLFMFLENLTGPPCGLSHVICAETQS